MSLHMSAPPSPRHPLAAPSPDPHTAHTAWQAALPAISFLLFVSLLRSPITAIPPLLGRVSADLGMNSVEMGALTSVPVLCFGVLTPVASAVMRRLDLNSSALWTLAIIMAGAIVRSTGTIWAAFLGTAVIAAGMTMGNLIAPMVIARNFRKRTALMTGAYSASINVAVTLSTALAMPLALFISWRASAAAWAIVPGIISGIVWWRVFPPHDVKGQDAVAPASTGSPKLTTMCEAAEPTTEKPQPRARIAAWPLAWIMATAFAGHSPTTRRSAGCPPPCTTSPEWGSPAPASPPASSRSPPFSARCWSRS